MDIVEVGQKQTKKLATHIKKNPAMLLIGGVGVVGVLYLLNRGGRSSVSTNNVDTVETVYTDGYNNISDNFTDVSTHYTESDVEKIVGGVYDYVDDSMSDITKLIESNQTTNEKNIDNITDKLDSLTGEHLTSKEYETLSASMSSLQKNVNSINTTVTNLTKNKTTTTKSSSTASKSTNKSSSTASNNTYKKTSYKGVSIVDGLKNIGVNSSFSNRKKIAKANGIDNYTGTAKQNTTLLNKLKAGTLKKA